MNALVEPIRRTVESIKNKLLKDLIKRQKPELDKKIDEMLKPPKLNQIMVKELGLGKRIGKSFRRIGSGFSLLKSKFRLS
ncbi:MAG: hypothetical protein KKD39_08455 [Candidatus Altiarchaeota archaeon]|nr:hypothetical protein [Candidatus Altiarchaeota archaeon]